MGTPSYRVQAVKAALRGVGINARVHEGKGSVRGYLEVYFSTRAESRPYEATMRGSALAEATIPGVRLSGENFTRETRESMIRTHGPVRGLDARGCWVG